MFPGEFETLFREMANIFTLETIAKKMDLEGDYPKRNPHSPIWDTIDTLYDCEYVDVGNGKYVSCQLFFKKTVRILFYTLMIELEGRLFRIHEWNGKSLDELNEANLNVLIKELVDSELIDKQIEYDSRTEFKKDLKAVSSFRNVIMHVNKKLEQTVDVKTVVQRKKQMLKLLLALQQILDHMYSKRKIN
ncbi:MAG: hypothetical protein HOE11_01595 [Candidatus Diapherotrites archaeon]|jgi:hypothetical protein|nr:hypothetical protein [Candidatus Diapherotrites archaeon]MBT4596462.1 hypothetical protein [Candidatus Diapherotrites archaeon]